MEIEAKRREDPVFMDFYITIWSLMKVQIQTSQFGQQVTLFCQEDSDFENSQPGRVCRQACTGAGG